MSAIFLIAGRELRYFFSTWIGYVIIFAGLLIEGLLFNAYSLTDEPRLSAEVLYSFFYFSSGIAMVASIFLGMRLLSEERTQGTLVLFLTSPLSERQYVLGKFLSVVLFFGFMQILSLYMPAMILLEGKISFGHLVSGYLGTSLLGIAVLSIALFASVISPNQLVSAIIAAAITVVFLVLWMLSSVVDNPLRDVFSYLSIHNQHFTSFGKGMIHSKHLIYYLSITWFFLECSVRALEYRRSEG